MKFCNFMINRIPELKEIRIYNVADDVTIADVAASVIITAKELKAWDSPFYICNLGDVITSWLLWKRYLPRIETYYAVKCNKFSPILKVLSLLGSGFDCASQANYATIAVYSRGGQMYSMEEPFAENTSTREPQNYFNTKTHEIEEVLKTGCDASKIIFAVPCKVKSQIQFARDNEINILVFDNEDELKKIKEIHPKAKLLLRIETKFSFERNNMEDKFGVNFDEGIQLLKVAQEMELNVIGLSCNLGTRLEDSTPYDELLEMCSRIVEKASKFGSQLKIIDLGGGYSPYESFLKFAEELNESLEKYFPEKSQVKIVAEPGRFMAERSCSYASVIHGKARNGDFLKYFIGEGTFSTFYQHRDIKVQPPLTNLSQPDDGSRERYKCKLYGPSLAASDVVGSEYVLPEAEIGDWLLFRDMGAYSMGMSVGFNGYSTDKICCFINRSKLEDLRKLVDIPECLDIEEWRRNDA